MGFAVRHAKYHFLHVGKKAPELFDPGPIGEKTFYQIGVFISMLWLAPGL